MKNKKNHFLMILIGVTLVALSVNTFLGPHNIAAGGASGLGIILNSVLNIKPSITVLMINIIVLVLAYLYLGVDVFFKSLIGSILFPILLAVIPTYKLLNDTLLSVVIGSVIFGLGVSILYKNDASSGGTTIPPMIFKKYFNIDKSLGLLMIDSLIVLLSLFTFGFESFVLAILSIVVTSFTMNYVSTGFNQKILMLIISEKDNQEMLQSLELVTKHGATIIPAYGKHSSKAHDILMIALNRSEYTRIFNHIDKLDPDAFVIVQNIKDIHSRGFTYESIV